MEWLFKKIFYISGWKIEKNVPKSLKKGVFCVCPHNTWKDFLLGLGARAALEMKIGYLGKEELFRPPFGWIFRALGGKPVHRFQNTNLVESQIKAIQSSEDMFFALAPEGTRKNVEKLRTGFYYMAHGAGIPIIRVGFDFIQKKVIVAEPFMPTGDFKKDMQQYFVPFFKQIGGLQKDWIANYEKGIF